MILGSIPSMVLFWWYWQFWNGFNLLFFLGSPLIFFIGIALMTLTSGLVAKFILSLTNLIHSPREGIFEMNDNNKDFRYWSLRSVIKKWPIWLARQLSLPILEKIVLKMFCPKISLSSISHNAWVDTEFIELEKNVRLGEGSITMSNIIIQNKLIIKKVKIEKNAIIGAHSLVLPGTIIKENSMLDSLSFSSLNQILKPHSIYRGKPAKKVLNNSQIQDSQTFEEKIFSREEREKVHKKRELEAHVKELSVPFHLYIGSGLIIIGGSFIIPGLVFLGFLFNFLIPNLFSTSLSLSSFMLIRTWIIIIITPLIIVLIYISHLFFIALFTRFFYRISDRRGPDQGIFDRNLDKASKALDYYHFSSFLLKYPIFAVLRSPFPWLLNWELEFIGSNRIGKNTVLEECYIHSHINYGKNCYVGTFAHISNHLVDGVYGEENLTFYGAEIEDNCNFNALIGGLPGLEITQNVTFLPMCSTIKFDKITEEGIYGGFPARKLSKENLKQILGDLYDEI
jgi:acetyltransferase-like isoleucine patch superfamily enzyme